MIISNSLSLLIGSILGITGVIIGLLLSEYLHKFTLPTSERVLIEKIIINISYKVGERIIILLTSLGIITGLIFGELSIDIINIIKDIAINLLGFTGLIFTFLMGNTLKNKSDLEKNLIDLEIQSIAFTRPSGGHGLKIYDEKIAYLKSSIDNNKNNLKKILYYGFISILSYIMSLIAIIFSPIYNKYIVVLNIFIFGFLFSGFAHLLQIFFYLEKTISE